MRQRKFNTKISHANYFSRENFAIYGTQQYNHANLIDSRLTCDIQPIKWQHSKLLNAYHRIGSVNTHGLQQPHIYYHNITTHFLNRTTPKIQWHQEYFYLALTWNLSMAVLLAMSLAQVLAPRLDSSEIVHRSEAINGVPRPAPEGVWVE